MKIDTNSLILVALVTSLILNLIQYFRQRSGSKIGEGDIVLYTNPGNKNISERNMLTAVLNVFPSHNTAVIRAEGTTTVVSQRHLTKIPVDRAFPIRVPGTPCVQTYNTRKFIPERKILEGEELKAGERISSGNIAKFTDVPLRHFGYEITLENIMREDQMVRTVTASEAF